MSRSTPTRSPATEFRQVAVIGGGIAGSVAAYYSARAGLSTVLFEKTQGPQHKVCGELLSAGAVASLRELGVDFKVLGAQRVRTLRLHGPLRSCESVLSEPAFGLSRWVLDEELLRIAAKAGAEIKRGVLVREMRDELEGDLGSMDGRIILETSAGEVDAKRLILASGKTGFRSVQSGIGRNGGMVAFKMHLKLKPSVYRKLLDHCDVFVFKGGYGSLVPIENGLANFSFIIERRFLMETGTNWDSLAYYIAKNNLAASASLDGAEPQFKHFVTISSVPYGFVRRERARPGIYFVGDQMAVIPFLAGDGMAIAAMTGKAAASALIDANAIGQLLPPEYSAAYQKQMRVRIKPQIESSFALHLLFKNPQICDWATLVVKSFPHLTSRLFVRASGRKPRLHLPSSDVKRLQV